MNQIFWRGKISTELDAKRIIEIIGYLFLFNSVVDFSIVLGIIISNSSIGIGDAIFNFMTLFYLAFFTISQAIPAISMLKTKSQNAAAVLLVTSVVLTAFFVFVESMLIFPGHGGDPGILLLWLSVAFFWCFMTYLSWRAFKATGALKALT